MIFPRVMPILLIENKKLVKTTQFQTPKYIGDPINAVKIFNEKEVDEIIVIDISKDKKNPDFELISKLSSECFMPMCYGGGIKNLNEARKIISCGVEKLSFNTLLKNPPIIKEISEDIGNQSMVCSLDIKPNDSNYHIYVKNGTEKLSSNFFDVLKSLENIGFGEILLTNICREGTRTGYDTKLISIVSQNVNIPLIAHGGAGCVEDVEHALQCGASACAIGSMVVYYKNSKSILINFPSMQDLKRIL